MEKVVKKPDIQLILKTMDREGRIPWETFNHKQIELIKDILRCKTIEDGLNVTECESCSHMEHHYCSCRNPGCCQCGAVEEKVWEERLMSQLLNCSYHHIVFTIPSILNPLCLYKPKQMYGFLFKAAQETLTDFSKDPRYMGVSKGGFIAVLHTWGSNLELHPHLHVLFCAGGITKEGDWKTARKKNFLFPAKAMAVVFKGKFMELLENSKAYDWILEEGPEWLRKECQMRPWNVEIREGFKNPEHVVKYLGRYIHRLAISNSRIKKYEDGKVTFTYKDYRAGGAIKEMVLEDTEFLRRFMMHVPPFRFSRIRYYGFMGNRNRKQRLERLREMTETVLDKIPPESKSEMIRQALNSIHKRDVGLCKLCGGKMKPPYRLRI